VPDRLTDIPYALRGQTLVDLGKRWIVREPSHRFSVFTESLLGQGTGHPVALADVDDQCVVLVAAAGSGKTAALWQLRSAIEDAYWFEAAEIDSRATAERLFSAVPDDSVCFLDALDESRCPGSALLAEIRALVDRNVSVRSSSRPTWWIDHGTTTGLDVVELVTRPIDDLALVELIGAFTSEPLDLLADLRDQGAGWVLQNPRMLINVAKSGSRGAQLADVAAIHRDLAKRTLRDSLDAGLVDSAYPWICAAAAVSLLRNEHALVTRPADAPGELDVHQLHQLLDLLAPNWADIFDSGHFAPAQTDDGTRFIERSTAEFLAADFFGPRIQASEDPPAAFRALFITNVSEEPRLVPTLRRVASWVLLDEPTLISEVPTKDLEVIVEFGANHLGTEHADFITNELLGSTQPSLHYRQIPDDTLRAVFDKASNVAEGVRRAIGDGSDLDDRWWVLEIIGAAGLVGHAQSEIEALALDESSTTLVRYWSTLALSEHTPTPIDALMEIAQRDAPTEDEQRLLGMALFALWPDHLTLDQVLALLQPNTSANGLEYWRFLVFGLPDGTCDDDLPKLIRWLEDNDTRLDTSRIHRYNDRPVERATALMESGSTPATLRNELIDLLVAVSCERNVDAWSSKVHHVIPATDLTDTEFARSLEHIDRFGLAQRNTQRFGLIVYQLATARWGDDALAELERSFTIEDQNSPLAWAHSVLQQRSEETEVEEEQDDDVDEAPVENPHEALANLVEPAGDDERWWFIYQVLGQRAPWLTFSRLTEAANDGHIDGNALDTAALEFVEAVHQNRMSQLVAPDGHVTNFGISFGLARMWLSHRDIGDRIAFDPADTFPLIRSAPWLSGNRHWARMIDGCLKAVGSPALPAVSRHLEHVVQCPNERDFRLETLGSPFATGEECEQLLAIVAELDPADRLKALVELTAVVAAEVIEGQLHETFEEALYGDTIEDNPALKLIESRSVHADQLLSIAATVGSDAATSFLGEAATVWDWRHRDGRDLSLYESATLALAYQEFTARFERNQFESGTPPIEFSVDRARQVIIDELAERGCTEELSAISAGGTIDDLIHDGQLIDLVDATTPMWSIDAVSTLLERDRWAAIDAEDAVKIAAKAIQRYERHLHESNQPAAHLRSEDRTPKTEPYLSDHLASFLRSQTSLDAEREVELRPPRDNRRGDDSVEQLQGEDVDLIIFVPRLNGDGRFRVATEVKKCTNRDCPQSMKTQLIDRYLRHDDIDGGAYIVYCFPDWNGCAHTSIAEMTDTLADLEVTSAKPTTRIAIDASL